MFTGIRTSSYKRQSISQSRGVPPATLIPNVSSIMVTHHGSQQTAKQTQTTAVMARLFFLARDSSTIWLDGGGRVVDEEESRADGGNGLGGSV